jgi:hypothetical protein
MDIEAPPTSRDTPKAQGQQHAAQVGMGARVEHLHRQPQVAQPVSRAAARAQQHQVRPQCDDGCDVRIL